MQRTLRGWMQAVFAAHGAGGIKKLVGLLQRVAFSAPNASFLELIYEGFGYDLGDETSYTTALNMRND